MTKRIRSSRLLLPAGSNCGLEPEARSGGAEVEFTFMMVVDSSRRAACSHAVIPQGISRGTARVDDQTRSRRVIQCQLTVVILTATRWAVRDLAFFAPRSLAM